MKRGSDVIATLHAARFLCQEANLVPALFVGTLFELCRRPYWWLEVNWRERECERAHCEIWNRPVFFNGGY